MKIFSSALCVAAIALFGSYGAFADDAVPAGITVQQTDRGPVFADERGMTLYTYPGDQVRGKSTCTNVQHTMGEDNSRRVKHPLSRIDHRPTCVQKNPPARVKEGAKAAGKWSILNRDDGAPQWMYEGRPLHTSIKDWAPGQVNGGGGGRGSDVLYVPASLPPGIKLKRHETGGVFLTNTTPQILFTYSLDAPGKSQCRGACAQVWKPVLAAELAMPIGDWSIAARQDGQLQWAYKQKPLYYFADGDSALTDAGSDVLREWSVAMLEQAVPLPPDLGTHHSIAGMVITTRAGLTVYQYKCREDGPDNLNCDDPADGAMSFWTSMCGGVEKCARQFKPVVPSANAKPDGQVWTIVTMPQPWAPVRAADDSAPGVKVWAYRGRPIFTFAADTKPGDLYADQFRSRGMEWASIPASVPY